MEDEDIAVRFACALISSGLYPTYQIKHGAYPICQQAWALTRLIRRMKPDHLQFDGVEE